MILTLVCNLNIFLLEGERLSVRRTMFKWRCRWGGSGASSLRSQRLWSRGHSERIIHISTSSPAALHMCEHRKSLHVRRHWTSSCILSPQATQKVGVEQRLDWNRRYHLIRTKIMLMAREKRRRSRHPAFPGAKISLYKDISCISCVWKSSGIDSFNVHP